MAWLPELGCTLANRQSNNRQARSIARVLGDVDELAAAVVSLARIAFRVFVGQHRTLRLEHRARDDVLRGDQFDPIALAAEFELDRASDLRIGVGEGAEKNEFERTDTGAETFIGEPSLRSRLSQEGERRGLSTEGAAAKG